MKPTLGVFGLGQFTKFFLPYLQKKFDVTIYNRNDKASDIIDIGANSGTLEDTASCEYLLLGYPADAISNLCLMLLPHISPDTIIFDICSVKTPVIEAMKKYFPDNELFTTHPIFGPQSGKNGISGLKIMCANISTSSEKYNDMCSYFSNDLELDVRHISPDEHDKEMAYVQGLTHLIGRALYCMDIPNAPLATESYKHLLETSEQVGPDTKELFLSIQNDNPYTQNIRDDFFEVLEGLKEQIKKAYPGKK